METRTKKFTISIPEHAFAEMERRRREGGVARSTVMLEALLDWLRHRQESELEDKYIQGYKKKPEKIADIEPFFRAGLASFSREDW